MLKFPSARVLTSDRRSRTVLPGPSESSNSPASGTVGGVCLLIDCSLYVLKHLLVDSALLLQRNKHSICQTCIDNLFSNGSKNLASDSRDPDPKLTGERSTGFLFYLQWKVTFQSERSCLSFSWVKVLWFIEFETCRRFYLEKIVDSKVGEVVLLVLERTGRQFPKHRWWNENLVVELSKKLVAAIDFLQRDQRTGIRDDALHVPSSVWTFVSLSTRMENP